MTAVVESLQLQTLVRFLRVALRSDAELLGALGATPDAICRGALEIEPVGIGDDKQWTLYVTELPTITAREISSDVVYAGPFQGVKSLVRLWYVIQPPLGESTLVSDMDPMAAYPVPDRAMADRWLKTVFWRVSYWIRKHRLTASGDDWDLHEVGQIYRLPPPTQVRYRQGPSWAMFEADLRMEYFLPPYRSTPDTVITEIDALLGDTNDPHEGAYVETEIDLT